MAIRIKVVPVAWTGCGQCDSTEPCYEGAKPCVNYQDPSDNGMVTIVEGVQSIAQAPQEAEVVHAPAPASNSPLMAALAASTSEELPPWESPPDYTILDALKEFHDKKPERKGRTLLLMGGSGKGSWQVRSYDPQTGRAVLTQEGGKREIKPVIGVREIPLYTPYWR